MISPGRVRIRSETPEDRKAVRQVHLAAFGRPDEARLVDRLRAEGHHRISLVAEKDARLVGHVLFSDLCIRTAAGRVAALCLAPLAVRPQHQRRGIGTALVRQGLQSCRCEGHRIVLVVGEPHFYRRFGFSSEPARPLDAPFPDEAFMALELVPGALRHVAGTVQYPAAFGDLS